MFKYVSLWGTFSFKTTPPPHKLDKALISGITTLETYLTQLIHTISPSFPLLRILSTSGPAHLWPRPLLFYLLTGTQEETILISDTSSIRGWPLSSAPSRAGAAAACTSWAFSKRSLNSDEVLNACGCVLII